MKRRAERIEGLVGTEEKGGERLHPAIEALVQRITGSREPGGRPYVDKGKSGVASREPTDKLDPVLEATIRKITG